MESSTWIAMTSIFASVLCMAVGAFTPALSEGKAVQQGLNAIAQQPGNPFWRLEQ